MFLYLYIRGLFGFDIILFLRPLSQQTPLVDSTFSQPHAFPLLLIQRTHIQCYVPYLPPTALPFTAYDFLPIN
jgi:hypothetical protein